MIVLLSAFGFALAALTAQPLTPAVLEFASSTPTEPTHMLISGAILLTIASVLKRFVH